MGHRRSTTSTWALAAALTVGAVAQARGQSTRPDQPAQVSRQTYDEWFQAVSNWGRWGTEDQLGTLNLITPDRRRAAARQVREGVTVSLARQMVIGPSPNNVTPMRFRYVFQADTNGVTWTGDELTIEYHGWTYSHIDGLSHTLYRNRMYNGFGPEHLTASGSARLGIDQFHDGIVARGVLVDLPRLRGVAYLDLRTAFTVADLEAWERAHRIRIGPGDIVLIRTGRWARDAALGPWEFTKSAAGPHPSLAAWLRSRQVAVLGGDGTNERYPSVVAGLTEPLHHLALVAMGMPLLDNLDLEAVAQEAARRNRWTFLFTAAPLRVPGGSGSPLNPLAVF